MQIARITPPAFPAVSADELETWLRIDAGSDPETLALLVGSATEIVEGLVGRVLGQATYRVEFDGLRAAYRFPLYPVQSIASVQADGQAITGWQIVRDTLVLDICPPAPLSVALIAGYDDVTAIPEALRHAIAVLVSASYNNREDVSDATMRTVERLCAPHRRIVW